MTVWAAKRFWKETTVVTADAGFALSLDGKAVQTPGKQAFVMPSRPMAEAAAAEWDAQQEQIDPLSMPVTRSVNSAIDQTAPQRAGVISALADYAETDLLCHHADAPQELARLQREGWMPLLDWAADRYGARLQVTTGILPVDQDRDAVTRLRTALETYGNFGITALYDLIGLSGSIVIGLAVAGDHIDAETGWTLSRIDEAWQIAQWGRDDEAEALSEQRKAAFLHAKRFLDWSGKD